MKKWTIALLALAVAQISMADTECKNSNYSVNVETYRERGCDFSVSGQEINLGYVGQVQATESGFRCVGNAYTTGTYAHAEINIHGNIATLSFSGGKPTILKCK